MIFFFFPLVNVFVADMIICSISLESMSSRQSALPNPVNITLKEALTDWSCLKPRVMRTDTWVVQQANETAGSDEEKIAFQQLLKELAVQSLHMVGYFTVYLI